MVNNPMQQNILIALQDIQTALERKNNTLLLLFRGDFQIIGGYFQGFSATWFSQKTNANAQQRIIKWALANAKEDNTSFTTGFEIKFKTSILIFKWCMELERRTQSLGKAVTKYAKAIRKLIKQIDSGRNWTEEQKIYSFTKRLRTDLSYAFWPLLALKDNLTIDMAIKLVQ
ncbi:hypothetical protein G9A89_017207 [Geosiphon pyriformis]|nr:hypothetical protein G9A89_017207 [Geosiphon pyriformis]